MFTFLLPRRASGNVTTSPPANTPSTFVCIIWEKYRDVYCGIQMWRNITAVTHNIHMLLFESSHFIHHTSTPSIIFTTGVFVSIYCLYCLSVSLFGIDLEVGMVWTRLFWIKSRGQFVQRYMYGSNMVWFWNDSHILEQTTDVDLKKDLCASYS